VPVAGLEQLADGDGGVDEADVGVGLRKVAELPPGLGFDVLRTSRSKSATASSSRPIIASASAHQNEQIVKALVVAPKSSACR
jgi:hypothetical protein